VSDRRDYFASFGVNGYADVDLLKLLIETRALAGAARTRVLDLRDRGVRFLMRFACTVLWNEQCASRRQVAR
jgi:hypothetical protein